MKKVIACSGGIDSTCVALRALREHPEVEWTLCYVDMKHTSSAKQQEALAELIRRHPEFKFHIEVMDLGFNPTNLVNGVVLQNEGVLPVVWAMIARYAKEIGADEVYTGYDRWNDDMERSYQTLTTGLLRVANIPINHFGPAPRGIAGTLAETGCAWADVDFTVSCSGDPDDVKNINKVPCGHCPKDIERKAYA